MIAQYFCIFLLNMILVHGQDKQAIDPVNLDEGN